MNNDRILPNRERESNTDINPKTTKKRNRPAFLLNLFDITEAVICAIAIAIVMLTFVIRTGYVDGSSMETTMFEYDRYILSELINNQKQGDIIVFSPDVEDNSGDKLWVKRIIAIEGQKVFIDPGDNKVYVDDIALDEPYINGQPTYAASTPNPIIVPKGYLYVMGDNRAVSRDSRYIGCVDKRRVVGKVLLRIYPFNKFGIVH